MEESILITIKKLLGMTPEYTAYDEDIKVAINSTFNVIHQLGVGPEKPFYISDDTVKWSDFLQDHDTIEMVKSYMFLKVKLIFDPPLNSSVLESYKQMAAEYEWRLHVEDDMIRGYIQDVESSSET